VFCACPSFTDCIFDNTFAAFHDDLDFVSVLEKLVQEFKAVTAPIRGKHSLDAQVENITKAKASGLTRGGQIKTAFLQVCI
jgi:nuclear pore complex protein Nup133